MLNEVKHLGNELNKRLSSFAAQILRLRLRMTHSEDMGL
jgi:hypothetical protein